MLLMLHYVFPDGMLSVTGWTFQILHFWDQAGDQTIFQTMGGHMLQYQRT
jgi:hypothetical protein